MCALAHFLERAGLATAVIGYVREHVARMRPPRALVVPFELGRPMGAPDEPAFQRRVLERLLALFAEPRGPVLAEFAEPAPAGPADTPAWVCPVSFAPPPADTPLAALRSAVEDEIERLRPWYAEANRRRGRTTVGISGVPVEKIPALMSAMTADTSLASPEPGTPMAVLMKRATDDLKAYYYEAATAKPGRVGDVELADWLWGETAFGRALLALRDACRASENAGVRNLGQMQLMPNHQRDKRGSPGR